MLFFPALLLLLVLPSGHVINPGSSTTYYVDATLGSDNHDGRSPATPWQAINKVNRNIFLPGDQILFKAGEEWRARVIVPSSGAPGNPIVFGAYGTGEAPIINGAILVNNWTSVGENIWKATLAESPQNGDPVFMVLIDKEFGIMKKSQSALAKEFDWWYDKGANALYLYAPSDPDRRYASPGVEAATKFGNVFMNGQDCITIRNLHLTASNRNAIQLDGNMDLDHITVENNLIDYCGGTGMSIFTGSENWIVRNNAIIHCGENRNNDGMYIYQGTRNIAIYGNISQWCGGDDVAIVGGIGHRIHHNLYGPSTKTIATGVTVLPDADDIEIYDNIIFGHTRSGGIDLWLGGSNARIYNNTIVGNNSGINLTSGPRNSDPKKNVDLKNNIIVNNATTGFSVGRGGTFTFAGNNVYGNGKNYSGISEPSGNMRMDPKFVNPANDDFHLQASSPMIDQGITLGKPYDIDFESTVRPQGPGWDIGADELGAGAGTVCGNEICEPGETQSSCPEDCYGRNLTGQTMGTISSSGASAISVVSNYPNPFSPATVIRYRLSNGIEVELAIYNVHGQRVRTLVSGRQEAGYHEAQWDGRNEAGARVASGV
jgi:hypothetical protein